MEIERKFLIHTLPENLDTYPHKEIEQGYINREPVVRIRRSDDKYILTCKGQGLMVREEFELPLTKEAFEHMKPKTDGIFIQKTRYLIPYDQKHTIELDVFHGQLAPLVLAEVEFSSIDDANQFIPPAWFGEDVTNTPKYHNSNLSNPC
ncbi:MAG: CYTH domain-containing protein [Lachnospiraceae bacterium]|nr:CYTH domain-containing protein [Lachnospiraceae bacterium]